MGSKTGYSVGKEEKKMETWWGRPGQREKAKVLGCPQSLGESPQASRQHLVG